MSKHPCMSGGACQCGGNCGCAARKLEAEWFKSAADMKKLLADIFRGVQPHVKNWRKFLVEMDSELKYWGTSSFPYESKLIKCDPETVYDEVGSVQVDSGSYYDPPDYVGVSADVPVGFDFQVQHTLDLRRLPLQLHKSMRSNIVDAKGFMQAVADVTNSSAALNMLGKIMIAVVRNYAKNGHAGELLTETDNAGIWSEIEDYLHDSVDGPVERPGDWSIESTKVNKVWYKLTGKGIAVNIVGSSVLEDINWEIDEAQGDDGIYESYDEYGDAYATDGRRRVYLGSRLTKTYFKA